MKRDRSARNALWQTDTKGANSGAMKYNIKIFTGYMFFDMPQNAAKIFKNQIKPGTTTLHDLNSAFLVNPAHSNFLLSNNKLILNNK